MKIKNSLIILMIALMGCAGLQARHENVRSIRRFDNELVRKPFALVCFYEESRELRHDKNYRETIKAMTHGISALSRLRRYKESGLNFIQANIAQDDILQTAQRYGVNQFPTYVLFKFGRPVRDKNNKVITLQGYVSSGELQDFIEQNLGKELAEQRERSAEQRLIRAEQAAYYWSTPYWGGYWEYPYWRRPYVGFGVGYYV